MSPFFSSYFSPLPIPSPGHVYEPHMQAGPMPHSPHTSTTAHTTPAPQRQMTHPYHLCTSTTTDNTTTLSPCSDDDPATPLPLTTTWPRTLMRAMATTWPQSPAAAPSAQQQPGQPHKAMLHDHNVATLLPTVPRQGHSPAPRRGRGH